MRSNGEGDLHPQEHHIVDKDLHLDDVQSFGYGTHDLVGISHGFLGFFVFCISSSSGEPDGLLCLLPFSQICGHDVFPS